MELTPLQLTALDGGQAVPLVDDGRNCVLLSDTAFENVRGAVDEWRPAALSAQMAALMRDDWSDSAMNVYDE